MTYDFTDAEWYYMRKVIVAQIATDTINLRALDADVSPDMSKELTDDIRTGAALYQKMTGPK